MGPGSEAKNLTDALGRGKAADIAGRIARFAWRRLSGTNSNFLGSVMRGSLFAASTLSRRPPTGFHRSIASVCQPSDPLRWHSPLPTVDVMIPFVEKDFATLNMVVSAIAFGVRNPVGTIFLVTPMPRGQVLRHLNLEQTVNSEINMTDKMSVISDEDALGPSLSHLLRESPEPVGGWRLQQLIKLSIARRSTTSGTLVLDADTVLIRKKTWLTGQGIQLLQFSEEFHQPYRDLYQHFFLQTPKFPASFVTHHQLIQRDIVREIFPSEKSLYDWFLMSLERRDFKLSEYETYGQYLFANHPNRLRFGSWANLWSPNFGVLDRRVRAEGLGLAPFLPHHNSVSFHSHSQVA